MPAIIEAIYFLLFLKDPEVNFESFVLNKLVVSFAATLSNKNYSLCHNTLDTNFFLFPTIFELFVSESLRSYLHFKYKLDEICFCYDI